jgi:hypothetical protein
METKKTLDDIFNDDDPFGLLEVKAQSAPYRSKDERLISTFEEINAFVEKNGRAPQLNGGIQEHGLAARLAGFIESPDKREQLLPYDKFNLMNAKSQEINSLDDIFDDDEFGIFDDDAGLFDFTLVRRPDERASADYVAKRKPCPDFYNYEELFESVHADLKENKRSFVEFKQGNLKERAFYMHNGVLFYLEKINISQREHYKPNGTRVREDGRTRCIFENGTESNMLKRSVEKILYANGKAITERNETSNDYFDRTFSQITDSDKQTGYIYVLKSKSENPEIKAIKHLYKIGFTTSSVEERIKNAISDPTYLMAAVELVMTFKCYNMNTHKFEKLLHDYFGDSCLEIEIFDKNGYRHSPREWFTVSLSEIEEFVEAIM